MVAITTILKFYNVYIFLVRRYSTSQYGIKVGWQSLPFNLLGMFSFNDDYCYYYKDLCAAVKYTVK